MISLLKFSNSFQAAQSSKMVHYKKTNIDAQPDFTLTVDNLQSDLQCASLCNDDFSCNVFVFELATKVCKIGITSEDTNDSDGNISVSVSISSDTRKFCLLSEAKIFRILSFDNSSFCRFIWP